MPQFNARIYRATAAVVFPRIADYTAAFVDSIATHDMTIECRDGAWEIGSAFGRARFVPGTTGFDLSVEADDPGALNRLKHALVGPIGFIAARERPDIIWDGDHTESALPDDLRILTVAGIDDLTPRLRRITFRGDDLGRYDRDDQLHCRLIFQPRGTTEPCWPMLDHRGHVVWPDDKAIPTRVYTIRRIDSSDGEFVVDFALHADPGPATRWALDARLGDVVGVLGPAAHAPRPAEFYVLIGDETALPGIARILEGLPRTALGHAFIEVDGFGDQLQLHCPPNFAIHWLCREGRPAGTTTLLLDAIKTVTWPADKRQAFLWGGCEHAAFSAIHRHLRRDINLPRDRFIFYSHWHRAMSEEDIIAKGAEAYLPG
jgi:NADPH-dependent ferric siderophore reductase